MPKLLSQSKHEEFESNSALQIRNKKERRAENARKLGHCRNFAGLRNFATCRILQVAKIRNMRTWEISQDAKFPSCCHCSSYSHCSCCLRNFLTAATVHPTATVHPALLTSCAFYFLTPFVPLLVLFIFCPQCNSVCYVILVIFKGGLAIKAPKPSIIKGRRRSSPVIKLWVGVFPLLSFSPILFPFLLFSRLPNTPLRMTTQRMVG